LGVDVVVDALYGPIFHRMLTGHAPLSDGYVDALPALVLDGIAPKASRQASAR
jgi:hypothetical protein